MEFSTSGLMGDVIWAMPTIRALTTEAEIRLIPKVAPDHNFPAALCWSLLPLLLSQPFISSAVVTPKKRGTDLDAIRTSGLNLSFGHIPNYYLQTFGVEADLSQPWLSVTPDERFRDAIIVQRTQRYRNEKIELTPLRRHLVIFLGTWEEYQATKIGEFAEFKDCLAIARAIAGCRLFVGNKSLGNAIAEALKVPRILEQCPANPNVQMAGGTHRTVNDSNEFSQALTQLLS